MSNRRIFIAINLPEDIKRKLRDYQEKWLELPIKWTKKDNLHITLFFLGYIRDEELLEICRITKEISLGQSSFFLNLFKICYGPENKIPPKMIWAYGEKSEEFISLKNNLERAFLGSKRVPFFSEKREFSPHITLGRIRQMEWKGIEPEERPEINEIIDLGFEVGSIDDIESELKKDGPRYTVLESCVLK